MGVYRGFSFNIPDISNTPHYQWQFFVMLINWTMIFFSYFYVCYRENRLGLFKDIFGLFFICLLAGFITYRALMQLFLSPFVWEKTNYTPVNLGMK